MINFGLETVKQILEFKLSEAETAEQLRYLRDSSLEKTDVWALSDRTMSDAQTAYRQALRDVTAQDGFPTSVTWPTKPE